MTHEQLRAARIRKSLRRLRFIAAIESATLLVLLFICVPMKYIGGRPEFSAVLGPVHGLAFIAYMISLGEAVAAGGWSVREVLRTAALSFVPFGPWFNHENLTLKIAQAER